MRGKERAAAGRKGAEGITPAYAGKSAKRLCDGCQLWDHPRVCGEKAGILQPRCRKRGSPPRMRGKGAKGHEAYSCDRITPAYAGKRQVQQSPRCVQGDHPRVCGEKFPRTFNFPSHQGSPPRMRGKGRPFSARPPWARITPAYAGKRFSCSSLCAAGRDHPRVCGEKVSLSGIHVMVMGSPPRMRGKVLQRQDSMQPHRITPAYAGKRSGKSQQDAMLRDHPRVCGEKFMQLDESTRALGSPPRMRGKGKTMSLSSDSTGITPAYAGKSPGCGKPCGKNRDHPRVCGEKRNRL